MKIFLVRHGTSVGNVDKSEYFKRHDSEIELTEKGRSDALNAGLKVISLADEPNKNKEYPTNDPIYFNLVHSTYKRATQTADIITHASMDYKRFSVQNVTPSPLCIEREWGSLRDIIESQLKTDDHFNFYYRPVNGESFCDTYKRAAIFHQWLLNTTKYENNIIVAHGEFNKVYLMHLLNWDVDEFEKWKNQKNGEVWLIEDGKLSTLTPLNPSPYKK
jgi:2,3-bisphosphoglycerate-dependent phosphoglycerate mutase